MRRYSIRQQLVASAVAVGVLALSSPFVMNGVRSWGRAARATELLQAWETSIEKGRNAYTSGDFEAASEHHIRALVIVTEEAFEESDPRRLETLIGLGCSELLRRKLPSAERRFRECVHIAESSYGEESDYALRGLQGLADVRCGVEDFQACAELGEEVLRRRKKRGLVDDQEALGVLMTLADAYESLKQPDAELRTRRRMALFGEEELEGIYGNTAFPLAKLALAEISVGNLHRGEELMAKSIVEFEHVPNKNPTFVGGLHVNYAARLAVTDRAEDAWSFMQRALNLIEQGGDEEMLDLAITTMLDIGEELGKRGQSAEGRRWVDWAKRLRAKRSFRVDG